MGPEEMLAALEAQWQGAGGAPPALGCCCGCCGASCGTCACCESCTCGCSCCKGPTGKKTQ